MSSRQIYMCIMCHMSVSMFSWPYFYIAPEISQLAMRKYGSYLFYFLKRGFVCSTLNKAWHFRTASLLVSAYATFWHALVQHPIQVKPLFMKTSDNKLIPFFLAEVSVLTPPLAYESNTISRKPPINATSEVHFIPPKVRDQVVAKKKKNDHVTKRRLYQP